MSALPTDLLDRLPATEPVDQVYLGGTRVDLMDQANAVATVVGRVDRPDLPPLAVVSANLDHIHHFGRSGRWHGVLELEETQGRLELLSLLDGKPLVTRARHLTGRPWQRLAGSDLIDPILDAAELEGATIGFLGGAEETQAQLRLVLSATRPSLKVAGWWAPPRSVVADPVASASLADEIAGAHVDILVVGMGKPRQELWIARHGARTGARSLLAFGAVVDFLAGTVGRAPEWMARSGLEWSYRLAQEPRRLARRYLVDGPPAYLDLQRRSALLLRPIRIPLPRSGEPTTRPTTVAVVVSGRPSPALMDDLEQQSGPVRLHIHVTDPVDDRLGELDDAEAVLMVDGASRLAPDLVDRLLRRLREPGVGIAVPRTVGSDGRTRLSLHFEPSPLRRLGDAALGSRAASRPTWLTGIDRQVESYDHPHPVEWSDGPCVLVRREVVASVGLRECSSQELMRRARRAGWSVWYEPTGVVRNDDVR